MKNEKLESLLYPDDYAELTRRIEEGRDSEVWSDDVDELFDKLMTELGGKKARATKYDFAEA
ncbi:hypothetical protein FWG76_01800 [Candidatus Saccharibacteria bacterium]|nr:hypothetical protein [Candidatus Saccharibacteria bacterium]